MMLAWICEPAGDVLRGAVGARHAHERVLGPRVRSCVEHGRRARGRAEMAGAVHGVAAARDELELREGATRSADHLRRSTGGTHWRRGLVRGERAWHRCRVCARHLGSWSGLSRSILGSLAFLVIGQKWARTKVRFTVSAMKRGDSIEISDLSEDMFRLLSRSAARLASLSTL